MESPAKCRTKILCKRSITDKNSKLPEKKSKLDYSKGHSSGVSPLSEDLLPTCIEGHSSGVSPLSEDLLPTSIEVLLKKFTKEVEDCRKSYRECCEVFEEGLKQYQSMKENFVKFETTSLKLLEEMKKAFPSHRALLTVNEISQGNGNFNQPLNEQMNAVGITNSSGQSTPNAKMEVVLQMVVLKKEFDELASQYDDLSIIVTTSTNKAFLKQLVKIEESYRENLEVFKSTMIDFLESRIDKLSSTEQINVSVKYRDWCNKLKGWLQNITSKREQLALKWIVVPPNSPKCGENEINLSKDRPQVNSITALNNYNDKVHSISHTPNETAESVPKTDLTEKCQEETNDDKKVTKHNNNNQETLTEDSSECSVIIIDDEESVYGTLKPLKNFKPEEIDNCEFSNDGEFFYHKNEKRSDKKNSDISDIRTCNGDLTLSHKQSTLSKDTKTSSSGDKNEIVGDVQNKDTETYKTSLMEACPGKSLPALDDMLPLKDQFTSTYNNGSLTTQGEKNILSPKTNNKQGQEKDEFIIESLMTEMGLHPKSPDHSRDSLNIGNHFLVPETILTEKPNEFLFNYSKSKQYPLIPGSSSKSQLSDVPVVLSLIKCYYCPKMFENKELLEVHLNSKHSPKVCSLCNYIATDVYNLQYHVGNEHSSFIVCLKCAKLENENNFSFHKALHKSKTIKEDVINIQSNVSAKLTTRQKLKTPPKVQNTSFYQCDFCEQLNASKYDLRKHKIEHLAERAKKHLCKVCWTHHNSVDGLLRHLRSSHLLQENKHPDKMECLICHCEFDESRKLIQHMKDDHQFDSLVAKAQRGEQSGMKRDKCMHCDVYLKNPKLRSIHIIIFHESPPYTCVCKAQFFTKALLDIHILKHTKIEETQFPIKHK